VKILSNCDSKNGSKVIVYSHILLCPKIIVKEVKRAVLLSLQLDNYI